MITQAEENRLNLLDQLYQAGYRAYERGLKTAPYPLHGERYQAWANGYERARHEYEDTPPEDE